MKRIFLAIIFLVIFAISLTSTASAHPGNTDSSGCHTCRTNCTDWGLYYGEYHCHTPKYTTPTCPIFSSYNSLSGSCECYLGYVASGGSCISMDQSCRNQLGYSSRYNSLSDKCECSYGYVIDTYGRCSSGNSICWNKYGYNSEFNNLDNTCECRYGYVFNQSGSKCISEDEACREQFGYGSKATISGDKCECRDGYNWEGNRCALETLNPAPIFDTENIDTPTPTPHLSTPHKNATPTSQAITSASPVPTADTGTDSNTNKGILFQLWNFIKKLFD